MVGDMISAIARSMISGAGDGRGRISAHAAGIGAFVAIIDALVILRRAERDRGFAVADREEAGLFAGQKILDHNALAGRAELRRNRISSIA